MRGQVAIDLLFAVLVMLTMLGVFTAFVDRGSVEVRRGLQYILCDIASTKFAEVESLLRLSGMGNKPGEDYTLQITPGGETHIPPTKITAKYNDNNVDVTIEYMGTTIKCMGKVVPEWQ